MTIEDRILALGKAFRSLVYHSDGSWSIQYRTPDKKLIYGKTIDEVLTKVEDRVKGGKE